MREVSVADTRLEVVQLVLPGHANSQGTLYGGRLMDWITAAATMAAMRLSRGPAVLGAMDDLDFVAPVRVGDVVTLLAQVEHVGRSSLEVGVDVHAEDPRGGDRRFTTSAHLALVAVDDSGRPRPVEARIVPRGAAEEEVVAAASARKRERDARLADRRAQAARVEEETAGLRVALEVVRIVFPDDAVLGTLMFAGRLMAHLDEVASVLALRHCRGPVVTASVDALAFYAPIRVGEIVTYKAALNHVGRTSMEVGVKVVAEHPLTGERRHTCTAFLTMVHVGPEGPRPVPPYVPVTEEERRRWAEAEARRARRLQRRARLRPAMP
ncbi:MAG: hotdog domain-containing protein [Armatimonadota bacterium]|nr:hotdog domain-containing protein [Armatimonadota bacterium]MDR7436868.1 hotdog domain-containing protein [Armatimonadota bacterium]MDR7471591.1 hotdog domain-containing protein [Armatimonadota bacterium]MDR7507593.1 hotdog domain-containing protein [Armatimonadota bacterium]MDR7509491.1 hotdog domain-containing protein [Armatimonadota bacterium]